MFMALVLMASDGALIAGRDQDERLTRIAYRLATACPAMAIVDRVAPLSSSSVTLPGFVVQDITQFAVSDREAARRVLGVRDGPTVTVVIENSPADRAGLRRGDRIEAVNGVQIAGDIVRAPYARMAVFDSAILVPGDVTLKIERGDGSQGIVKLLRPMGCSSLFQLVPGGLRKTQADGRYVQISQSMFDLAQSDDELAAVIAHELGHNALRHHRVRLSSKQAEYDADRFAVQLVSRAGYDLSAMRQFWVRLRAKSDYGVFSDGSHPSWPKRLAAIDTAIAQQGASQRQKPR